MGLGKLKAAASAAAMFAVTLTLGGCITPNTKYARIGAGPALIQARARCNILKHSADRGYVAFGSASHVAGAALGNAIGNAMRENEFMKNCMIMQGWQPLTDAQAKKMVAAGAAPTPPQQ